MKIQDPSKQPALPKGELGEAELKTVSGGTDAAPKPPAPQSNLIKSFSDTQGGIIANMK